MLNSTVPPEPPAPSRPLTVTVKTACAFLGVGRTTMWALVKAERVKTTRVGRRRLIIFASLEALVAPAAGAASRGPGRP